ncbi:MAG: hypothetical protein HY738_08770, partial [Bacteroidia bacterium]|nr:hypothetical protein [Bacteroidia bacterium]
NRSCYSTNTSMALNLGVYGADLSFATMFDQGQTSIKYIAASKKLAEDLGILDAISKNTIDRMEKNSGIRDSLMEIITETFMNSNSFLRENDRASIAAIILIGGWIEGVYIASKVTQSLETKEEMLEKIADQRLSLSTLLSLLQEYQDDKNIVALSSSLKDIETVFNKVTVTTSPIEVVTDPQNKKTILKSATKVTVTPEVFAELCEKITIYRDKIIKGEII